jgi:hypothetical protein
LGTNSIDFTAKNATAGKLLIKWSWVRVPAGSPKINKISNLNIAKPSPTIRIVNQMLRCSGGPCSKQTDHKHNKISILNNNKSSLTLRSRQSSRPLQVMVAFPKNENEIKHTTHLRWL